MLLVRVVLLYRPGMLLGVLLGVLRVLLLVLVLVLVVLGPAPRVLQGGDEGAAGARAEFGSVPSAGDASSTR